MADAYATLANGGIHHDPTAISRVEFPNGKVDETDPDSGDRVLTEGQAYEVTKILEGVITQGTGAGYTYMGCAAEAGKTGTSEDASDAWFVGYTPLYSTAVWVGHPQSREYDRLRRPDRRADLALLHGIGGRPATAPNSPNRRPLPELCGPRQRPHLGLLRLLERIRIQRIRRRRIERRILEGRQGRKKKAEGPPPKAKPKPPRKPRPNPLRRRPHRRRPAAASARAE